MSLQQNEMEVVLLGGGGKGDQMEVDQVVPDQPLEERNAFEDGDGQNITEEGISWMRFLGLIGDDVFEPCVSDARANPGEGVEANNVAPQVLDALDVQVVPQLPFQNLVENCLKDLSEFSDQLLHVYFCIPRGEHALARAAIKLAQKQCVGLHSKLKNIQEGCVDNNDYPGSHNALDLQNKRLHEVYGILHETKILVKPFLRY